jgi:probable phosphoglycerate mutase
MVAALSELVGWIGPGELAVAVSHGAAIRDAVPVLLGWPVAERAALHGLDNCAWVELDRIGEAGPMRLVAYNRTVTPDFASARAVG